MNINASLASVRLIAMTLLVGQVLCLPFETAAADSSSILDRWRKKPGTPADPSAPAVPGAPAGKRSIPGYRIMAPNQTETVSNCDANPYSCICPDGTFKTTFWETEAHGQVPRKKVMCVSTTCPLGKIFRRRVDVASGKTSFACLDPWKPNMTPIPAQSHDTRTGR